MSSVVRSSIVTALALLLVVGIALVYLNHWATTPLPLREPVIVELMPGMSFGGFASELRAASVMERDWLFTTYARLHGTANRIQAGEYRVAVGATPASLLADLVAGAVATYEVRIVEGTTIMQVMRQLATTPKLIDDVEPVSTETLLTRLQLAPGNAEGRFFPDTYSYKKGTHISEILLRAHDRMTEVLERAWESRASGLPYATPNDALIMASIIEKETGRDDERTRISRVFVSRLQRAMRLQTDPAVIYGLGDAFDGNLTRDHLNADTPYNTYKQIGLPPTPIALPGLASIEAAMHPDDGDFLYFVARGDGSSEFSATLDQHLAAVRRYQLNGGMMVTRGKFITFEGTEGVGKTTNMDFVEQLLVARGINLIRTREPGGTPMAERVRTILLDADSEPIDPEAELLLVFAARAQHVARVIRPALAAGTWVLCDRFTDATYAYQGGGRGLSNERIGALETAVQGDLQPDLTIYLDLPVATGLQRIEVSDRDRFEREQQAFFERVRGAYLRRAKVHSRFRIVDAGRPLPDVQLSIASVIRSFIDDPT